MTHYSKLTQFNLNDEIVRILGPIACNILLIFLITLIIIQINSHRIFLLYLVKFLLDSY